MTAQRILDEVHSLARVGALEAEPQRYAAALEAEVPEATTLAELEARDAMLASALGQLDAMISRVMRLRLEHALAMDSSSGPPTRQVFATTIVGYANNLTLLTERARSVAARGGAADPDQVATLVDDAARSTLALRDAVRAGVLALIAARAAAIVPDADRHARDRKLDDAQRRRWIAARRELEAIAAEPHRVTSAPLPTRLAAWPEQLDDAPPEPEVTFADMIELD
ncbi:MAG: hypothetical protein M3619_00170 [Myxococcota bacterium]|nr:hypothetical protein [Myxococcota bacterium]